MNQAHDGVEKAKNIEKGVSILQRTETYVKKNEDQEDQIEALESDESLDLRLH